MKKATVKKTTTKKNTTTKAAAASRKTVTRTTATRQSAKKRQVRVASKAADANTCPNPTTLFEVEFPTTILFWAGVALFFLFVLLMFTNLF